MRELSPVDRLIAYTERAVRTLQPGSLHPGRANPGDAVEEHQLDEEARDLSVRLLRVDHTGEVCAQALYQGQALTAGDSPVRRKLEQAAEEEVDHLAWCERRLKELGGRTSVLNPLFYAGSFAIGAAAGTLGKRWNLGFLAETERQVTSHLDDHLARISPDDRKSRAVLEQMKADEQAHATTAVEHGGARLPAPVSGLMRLASRAMTGTTQWI